MPSIQSSARAIDQARAHSFYFSRLLAADPSLEATLLSTAQQPFTRADMQTFAPWLELDTPEKLSPALRRLRQSVMARLIVRDLGELTQLDEVLATMTNLAEFCLLTALSVVHRTLQHYGQPIGELSGCAQELIIIGMGKLGGSELNTSSDIDLIFIYPENGQTSGPSNISNHEYFCQAGKKLIALINDVTADGQVFRVDMRLRPYGDSGPLAMSFTALENYLLTQGREWERYAWIKARGLTGDIVGLSELIRPFVYRKYLDYNAYGAMRELSSQIRREVARRDLVDNIKLGPGGIREIEFIAQVFQLIRGGREKSLQLYGTRETLARLDELGLLEPEAVQHLLAAYTFLRNLEHRLQYVDDQQTQTLPRQSEALERIASSMHGSGIDELIAQLEQHRRQVTRHFEQVFFLPSESAPDHPLTALWRDIADTPIENTLSTLGYQHPDDVNRLLKGLAASQRYQQMALANRKKFDGLIPPLIEVASQFPNPDATLTRILTLMEAISRRAPYLALLTEYPQTLQRLASLSSASAWVSTYLTRHPILLDELLDARVLYKSPDWPQLEQQLEQQLIDCDDDVEAKMDALRHFHHTQIFRLVAQDLAGMWTVEALSDELSLLADKILGATLRHAWQSVAQRHCDEPHFAITGYGKLGGKELGYASDLDIIFLYDDPHPDAADNYSRLARKISTWLTSATSAGILYDIDLRLRPNGSSGLLVSTLSAFEQYQQKSAWVWEHQALTRARFVAGDSHIGQQFESARQSILCQPREPAWLAQEVSAMRTRMLETHPALPADVKHARGGLIDIEFIIQYLILAHANTLPELTANTGTIALLAVAARHKLIPEALAEQARQAYRALRKLQHAARLNEANRCEVTPELKEHYRHAIALWHYLFVI